jgi:hypothetical protein
VAGGAGDKQLPAVLEIRGRRGKNGKHRHEGTTEKRT